MSSEIDRPRRNIGGPVLLITLGIILLLKEFNGFSFHNWWALFILIPFFTALASALSQWENQRRITYSVWNTFYGGLFPLAVALMFLFKLSWRDYWPIFIIIPGFGALINGMPFALSDKVRVPEALLFHRSWSFFIGIGALVLGFGFLGLNLNWFETLPLIPFENWWGVPILIAALGGVLTAVRLLTKGKSIWLVLLNLAGAAAVGLVGVIAIFNLNWELMNMVAPILLMLAGLTLLMGFGSKKEEKTPKEKY